MNTTAINLARVTDVLDLDLGRMPVKGSKHSVGVPTMKMVLLCVMRNEGRRLGLNDICEEIGVARSAVWRAMKALRGMNLVVIGRRMSRGYTYRINSAELSRRADDDRRRRATLFNGAGATP